MANVCSNCGAFCPEQDAFCERCGASMPHPQARSAVRQPRISDPNPATRIVSQAAKTVMNFMPIILVVMLVFTLVIGIMNFTAGHEVKVTASATIDGETQKESQNISLSEIYEAEEFIPLVLAGLAYGALNIVLTVYAGFIVFKIFTGSRRTRKHMTRYTKIGLIGNLVYLLLVFLFGRAEESMYGITMKAVISPHFTVWVETILFAFLTAAAVLAPRKHRKRA